MADGNWKMLDGRLDNRNINESFLEYFNQNLIYQWIQKNFLSKYVR